MSGDGSDPVRTAQAAARPALPSRFYKEASVRAEPGGYALLLDGRPARTPARRPLALPTAELAEAVAAEWRAQGEVIDPAAMPLTRIANSAIDGVADGRDEVEADILRYAGSDLLCYRAGEPDRLVAAQTAAWDPVLAWARDALGARFVLSEGVGFVEQPASAREGVAAAVREVEDPFGLAALHVMTTLTGSVLLALAVRLGRLSPSEAWAAAHVDETYQESLWGSDEEALRRRARRQAEFEAAALVARLSPAHRRPD